MLRTDILSRLQKKRRKRWPGNHGHSAERPWRKRDVLFLFLLFLTPIFGGCLKQDLGWITRFMEMTGGCLEAANAREINPDFLGILSIEGCLREPVVRGSDNFWYLTHDFSGNPDSHGCLFADASYRSWNANLVIYGHNTYDGNGFSSLIRCKEPSFVDAHDLITLQEAEGTTHYRIILVMNYNVEDLPLFNPYLLSRLSDSYKQDLPYRVYYRKDSMPDHAGGRKMITLSTCDETEYGQAGRLLVIGEEI